LALWFLGRPDSALRHAEQARALAEAHPYSLASAEVQLAYLHQYRGEPPATLRWAEQAGTTAIGHGFPIRAAQAAILGGWARAVMGTEEDGVGDLRSGLAMYLATGAELDHPYYLGLLGEALAAGGPAEEGLAVVEEASQAADAYGRAIELAAGQDACAVCPPARGRPLPWPGSSSSTTSSRRVPPRPTWWRPERWSRWAVSLLPRLPTVPALPA
jgi:predicted ATPase